jgi:hypothetical protein
MRSRLERFAHLGYLSDPRGEQIMNKKVFRFLLPLGMVAISPVSSAGRLLWTWIEQRNVIVMTGIVKTSVAPGRDSTSAAEDRHSAFET